MPQTLISFEEFEAQQQRSNDWVCSTLPPEIVAQVDQLLAVKKPAPVIAKWLQVIGYGSATSNKLRWHRDNAHQGERGE